jgi:hypothetical protein
MNPAERDRFFHELEPLRAARVPLDAVRWTHGREDGPIALVTGPGSRARADFSSGLKKTARYVRVEYFLARLDDPTAIAAAVRRAKDAPGILVIAVCRGGGDEHDLSVFSHPDVVRAVAEAASIKPVVTGIGHTEDHCLADDYASVAAELPYAAGAVIHQARQSAWWRLQQERAPATYARAPPRRRTARPRGQTVKLILAGVLGVFLAIASCPPDPRRPATTSHDLAPTPQLSWPTPQPSAPTLKRSAPFPQQPAVARLKAQENQAAPPRQQPAAASMTPLEGQAAPPAQPPALAPTSPPKDEPSAPPEQPAVVPESPWGDQG